MIPGWILSLPVLAPNLLMIALPPTETPPTNREPAGRYSVLTGVLGRVGQVGCFALPILCQANTRDEYTLLALEIMLASLVF